MKTLYISDLDGTLLDKNAELSKRSAEIINELIYNGMMFSVATARSSSASKILGELKLNIPCVQLNGVLLYDFQKMKYIDCASLDVETAKEVIRILKSFNRISFVYKFDENNEINVEFESLSNNIEQRFFNERKDNGYKSFKQTESIIVNDNDRVIYLTMIDTYERLLPIFNEIKKLSRAKAVLYSDNYSNLYFLEIFSSGATKAAGVLKLKELVNADRIVAFGDNINDIDMLRVADVGIVVGNCVEEVKKYANIIIGNSYEDGVAEYLINNINL